MADDEELSCMSLDAEILMCEDCGLVLDDEPEIEYWTLTNGMNIVPCGVHLPMLMAEDHNEA